MNDVWAYWRSCLAGEKPKAFVDQCECGFYRRAIYTKEPNKAAKRTGWTPVAIFMNGQELTAIIGVGRDAKAESDPDKLNTLWTYIAANPISEATYRSVAERGEPWPDSHETGSGGFGIVRTVISIPAVNSSAAMHPVPDGATASSLHNVLGDKIDDAEKHLTQFLEPIDSDEMASKARSLQLKFLELKGEAEKEYEAVNRPLLDEQKRLRGIWFPLRDRADEHSKTLRRAMSRWEDTKREASNAAYNSGMQANVPPPSTQIKAATGRAASVTVEKVVTAIDVDKVFQQFKTAPQVIELLTILAQKAIRSGIDVPGATVEERSNVR